MSVPFVLDYHSTVDETVELVQGEEGLDEFATLTYAAIDETNWMSAGGILWGAPARWPAIQLDTVPWMGLPGHDPGVLSHAEYDAFGSSPGLPAVHYRGAFDLALGVYDLTFHARWRMLTVARAVDTVGYWNALTEIGTLSDTWETHVNPLLHRNPIFLPPDDDPVTELFFEDTWTTRLDLRDYAGPFGAPTIFNTVGIVGPTAWGRMLKATYGSTMTVTRYADAVAGGGGGPPGVIAAGAVRRGRVDRTTDRTGRRVPGASIG